MTRIDSVNHAGWVVEKLTEDGWESILSGDTFPTLEACKWYLDGLAAHPDYFKGEYRCYEALHMKEQA